MHASYSNFRKTQARKYAEHAALLEPVKWANTTGLETPQICIGIGSVNRQGFSYLKETLGSVLEGLDESERRRIYVVVFLAHVNQSQHEDYGAPWLKKMADALPTYPSDPELLKLVQKLDHNNDYPAHARKQKIEMLS